MSRQMVQPMGLHMNVLVLSLLLVLHGGTSVTAQSSMWGTFRPQAMISARAAVPHSPFFGFMYHPASSLSIRHLSTENHDKISSFSWSRHDGRQFGDQHIIDVDLNLNLSTHFQLHPSKPDAWAIRVSGAPLDSTKPARPVSLVFYAAAGPDEIDAEKNIARSDEAHLWGSLRMSDRSQLSKQGIDGNVILEGKADSVGGNYRVIVKEPAFGVVSDVAPEESVQSEAVSLGGGTGSRAYRRSKGNVADVVSLPVDTFHVASLPGDSKIAWAVEKALERLLRKGRETEAKDKDGVEPSVYLLSDDVQDGAPGLLVQRLVQAPFEMEATFVRSGGRTEEEVSAIEDEFDGDGLGRMLERSRERFDEKFAHVFGLGLKGVSVLEQTFAKAALSNLLGGIGYFYGSSVAHKKKSDGTDGLEFLSPVGLLTATPSRALFPRGFLWDEGFHQLVVQRWDQDLSSDCMRSWMGAIQKTGWIPREQILGVEARSRFPRHVQHLMIQNPKVANPPTILMPLRVLASVSVASPASNRTRPTTCESPSDASSKCASRNPDNFSLKILEHVIQYYAWLKRTQSGEKPNSFRWRGRSPEIKAPEGYPLTLASGLDDYPRAEVPSMEERHVDLHCWMTWASGALAKLSESAGRDPTVFLEEHETLRNALIDLHGSHVASSKREDLLLCDYDGDEKICHEGYTTILPLALGLLDPSDIRISAILDSLEDPLRLKARAGVRSLSRSDKWHRKGDDYWTGSVWMPFNFLTLAALRSKYSVEEGPYKERAGRIMKELQKSIVENAFRVFSETGQLWENYSPDDDGSGKSGRQFTGWSSLVLLMYADMYDGVT